MLQYLTLYGESSRSKFARGLQHAFGQPRGVQASFRADEVLREMNSKLCEWCDKDMTTSCSQCREIHLCSKACMKLIWMEGAQAHL